jgi:hypothetical protein
MNNIKRIAGGSSATALITGTSLALAVMVFSRPAAAGDIQQDQAALQAAQAEKAKADAAVAAAQAILQKDSGGSTASQPGSDITTSQPSTDNTTSPANGTGILGNPLPDNK